MLWVPFLVLYVTRELGMTYSNFMVTEIAFSFAVILLEVPTGLISDYVSRKLSWILGSVFLLVGSILMIFMNSFWFLLIAQISFAFWIALHSGSNEALVYDSLKYEGLESKYTKILSRGKAIAGASMVVASLFAGFVLSISEIKTLFYIFPIFVLVSFFLSFFLIEAPRDKKSEESKLFDVLKESLEFVSNHEKVFPLVMFMGFVPAFTKAIFWLFAPLLIRLGIDEVQWGNVNALNRVLGILILMGLPYLLSKFKVKLLSKFVIIVLVLGLSLLFINSPFFAIFGFVAILNMRFVVSVVGNDELNRITSSEKRATVLSLVGLITNLIFAIGGFFSTKIFDKFGYEMSLLSLAIMFLVPIIYYYILYTQISKLSKKISKK